MTSFSKTVRKGGSIAFLSIASIIKSAVAPEQLCTISALAPDLFLYPAYGFVYCVYAVVNPAGTVLYRKQERKFHPLRQLLPDDWLWQLSVKSKIGDASGSWCSYQSRIVWRLPAHSPPFNQYCAVIPPDILSCGIFPIHSRRSEAFIIVSSPRLMSQLVGLK